ncbi:MAG: type I restriction-modification enzyme R subunit C-terminal domain-containing protein [Methanothrix sp.]
MTPEEAARQKIDELLTQAGWKIQDFHDLNLGAALGVAVREFPLQSGFADYLLFIDREAVGAIEAKPEGTTLSGVEEQTGGYLSGLPEEIPHISNPLPFGYESTGTETFFVDMRDPNPRSRRVFAFHKPQTLKGWRNQGETLRARLKELPALARGNLRDCQSEAITNLERSFAAAKPRSLIQMATGSGKTFAAVSFIYRLIKFGNARRVLFLVDRRTLGEQALTEFKQYVTPDDGRKFTELYNVQHLTSNTLDPVCRVCITTIQRLYSMLRGEAELDTEIEEQSLFDVTPIEGQPLEIAYNPEIPVETFDFVITDECHRSIYNLWRQVLEYFDAFLVGMTATPSKQTLGFFNQNLVMEYNHERAVADGVNVGYEVYRIKTEISERGSKVEAGYYIDIRDKLTREKRWEMLDEDLEYSPRQLDRNVVATDQIRTVIRTFKEKLPEIFPERAVVPKTLIFAKDDSHAEDIVRIVREEFGKGNDFCKKITYRTQEKSSTLISNFRNSPNPRIAVTVDMISTGTDIKPLECLIFMRDVKSQVYFEQMKGRGTRTISPTDLESVTPGARYKTHFVIVDAVGVCERDKTDTRPLEQKKSVSFEKLVKSVALGVRSEKTLTTLAGRLARLDRELSEKDRSDLKKAAGDKPLKQIMNDLLDAIDPDKHQAKAREIFQTETPSAEQVKSAAKELARAACLPFDYPKFRNALIDIKKRNEQIIDELSKDVVLFAGGDTGATERAHRITDSFRNFIEENKDELTALQIIYGKPYGKRRLTYEEIKQLAEAIEKPPYHLTPDLVWRAYEYLEKSKVKGAGPQKLLTNIISLVRFALGESPILQPFTQTVDERFAAWMAMQERTGQRFTPEQAEWLEMLKEHIATSLRIDVNDLELAPFYERGGPVKAYKLFGPGLGGMLEELNEALAG